MKKDDAVVPEKPKESADGLSTINEDEVDHSRSAPGDEETPSGPSVEDAFRGGS